MAASGLIVPLGKTIRILEDQPSGGGTTITDFIIESDSVIMTLFASSITGSLDVTVETLTDDGKTLQVITFPSLTAATTDLVLKKAAAVMSRMRVRATYTGACVYELYAKGIRAGETSVRVLGASSGKAQAVTVGTTAQVLLPAALTDRAGIIVKNNNSGSGILYIGFTSGEAAAATGFPISPGDSLAIDIASGATLYASGSANIDVRILEAAS